MAMYTYAFYTVTTWFMAMPDPTTAQTGFVSVVVGAGAAWFGLYCGSGKIVKPEEPKAVSVEPVKEVSKTEELKKEDKKVEAKAEKQTSEKK